MSAFCRKEEEGFGGGAACFSSSFLLFFSQIEPDSIYRPDDSFFMDKALALHQPLTTRRDIRRLRVSFCTRRWPPACAC